MTARLNGGPPWAISVGPDRRRLVATGDFNLEIAIDDLAVDVNRLRIEARFADGTLEHRPVEIVRSVPQPPKLPFVIDWASEGIPNRNAQVVDGLWEVIGRYVSTREIGYDRLIAIGGMSWRDYEVLVPVVVHEMEARAFSWAHMKPPRALGRFGLLRPDRCEPGQYSSRARPIQSMCGNPKWTRQKPSHSRREAS